MRRLSTGMEQLLTTRDVADAVVTYAAVLARAATSDTVTIPIVDADGAVDTARLLLGPASQLTIVPDEAAEQELPAAESLVEDLRARGARLEPVVPADRAPHDVDSAFPDFDVPA